MAKKQIRTNSAWERITLLHKPLSVISDYSFCPNNIRRDERAQIAYEGIINRS